MLLLSVQFLFWLAGAIGFAYWLVETYARPDTQLSVKQTVMVCWVLSFSVPFLLPADFYGGDHDAMVTVWTIIYIGSGLQCWLFVPLLQNYFNNGGFSFKDKVKQAFLIEVKFYMIVGVIALSLVGIMLIQGTFTIDEQPGLILVLANTWGLGLLTIVLGYGVVALPRYLWSLSDTNVQDRNNYLLLANIAEEACTEQDRLQQTNAFVDRLVSECGGQYADKIRSMLLPVSTYEFAGVYPGTPMENFPKLRKLEARFDANNALTHSEWMKLHYFCIQHRRAYRLAYSDWNDAAHSISFNDKLHQLKIQFPSSKDLPMDSIPPPSPTTYAPFPGAWIWILLYGVSNEQHRSVNLEDDSSLEAVSETNVLDTQTNQDNITRKVYLYPLEPGTWYTRINAIWFKFYLYDQTTVIKLLSVFASFLSVFTLYSEMTIMIPTNISIMTLVERDSGLFFILLTTLPLLLYITLCSFYTQFRFRLFSFYHMHKRQRTGEASILHNAAFTLRLIMPLGYNYFRIQQDKDTAFTKVNGAMDSIPFLGGAYNTYMPAFVLVVAGLSLVGPKLKIFKWLGFVTFEDDKSHFDDGKELFAREMNFRQNGIYEDARQTERRLKRENKQASVSKYRHKGDKENQYTGPSVRGGTSHGAHRNNPHTTSDDTLHTLPPPPRSNASKWDAKNTFKLDDF